MSVSCGNGHLRNACALLLGVGVLALPLTGHAWQSSPPVAPPHPPTLIINTPPPAVQFQQKVQRQQVRDQLQKRQLQGSLHQAVSDHTRRLRDEDPRSRRQAEQADQAQRNRDRAAQQDLLNRYQQAIPAPPVQPAASRSSE